METRKIRSILIATGIYPPSIGGPATYAKLLSDELIKYGIKPKIVSFDSVRKWPKVIRHILYFFLIYFKSRNIDLIYALDPVSVGLAASYVSMIRGKWFYLRIAGDYAWEQGCQRYGVTDNLDAFLVNHNYPKPVLRFRKIERRVARRAKKIIVPSKYLSTMVQKWGIDSSKISVIGNAVEGVVPEDTRENLKRELNIKTGTIISAGRFVPWKGFAILLEGISDFLKSNNLNLKIIGDGPDKKLLESIVEKNDLADRVEFLGSLSKQDLLRYIKASDVFVLNTAYEGFSHQILEAMTVGTPVVTTDVCGNPELIDDGIHGFLVPLNDIAAFEDKIKMILDDNDLADKISKQAKERADLFTKSRAIRELISTMQ